MKNKMIQTLKILMIIVFSIGLLTAAGQPKATRSIEKSIEIMEGVLEQLIVEESPIYFRYKQKFPGKYFKNFGILFNIKSIGVFGVKENFEFQLKDIQESITTFGDEKKVDIKISKKIEENNKNKKEKIEKKINTTVDLLYNFFADYTRSVMNLSDNEVIVINIDMGEKKSGYNEKSKESNIPQHIRMTAKIGDLKKYHTGKYSLDKLKNKISLEKIYDTAYQREINIMEKIFDTALNKNTDGFLYSESESDGLYIPGFGALFSIPIKISGSDSYVFSFNSDELIKKAVNLKKTIAFQGKKLHLEREVARNKGKDIKKKEVIIRSDGDSITIDIDDDDSLDILGDIDVEEPEEHEHIFQFFSEDKFSEEQVDSITNEIQDEVIEILSLYGSTLKSVKDNEMINITLDLGNINKDEKINILAKKSDIEKCSLGKMKYDTFKKSITIWKE